jgi:hypothetical protein
MSHHLALVENPDLRQWCAANQRWFTADDVMAGACLVCRAQILREEGER